ncbi:MAG: aconitate hydratase [Planctomycetaceae bacterium]|jgi:aconitate hydratase
MPNNLTRQLIAEHLLEGDMTPGEEIALRIDQTLTQDATGTLVMLELEAMELDRVQTEVSVQYVDHNLIQEDHKNPDDHLFLESACRRFGVWYSRAGNGVSHPLHQERFGKPGKTLLGSDSHTPAAGALGMFACGAGGLEVALAMAGQPFYVKMPSVIGVEVVGALPDWVSAKDAVLELLRRNDVDGAVECVLEYYGPGLESLSAMDRHVMANMGTEIGATTSVFPSDQKTRRFLKSQGREDDWIELAAEPKAEYDRFERLDLSQLEPLIAMPSSPGNVVPVREVAGREIYQCYVGSSANPGYRDFAIAAEMVKGRQTHPRVSFDINPSTRQLLLNLIRDGHLSSLIAAGARLHQAGCNGCIGMGQAPATGRISLRTVPRNFPGRSGTREDQVCLVSPETATASALTGVITDPRNLNELAIPYPQIREPAELVLTTELLTEPPDADKSRSVELVKGPNIASLPDFDELSDELALPVLLITGDDISTDEILPAGTRVLPYRSNIPKIAEFAFEAVAPDYAKQALKHRDSGGHIIIGGENYGQGSSREHAALAPRYLGLRVVIAKSFARIHWQNLINFGVLPLTFADASDAGHIEMGHELSLSGLHRLKDFAELRVENLTTGSSFDVQHTLSPRQIDVLLAGGLLTLARHKQFTCHETA